MAALLRTAVRQGRVLRALSNTHSPVACTVPLLKQNALISTSEKKKDVGGAVEPMEKSSDLKKLIEHFENTDKDNEENYTSYGYAPGDRDTDWFYHHLMMFLSITLGLCGGGFILAYMPDLRFADWTHREAFLELERRKREGLPLVDMNYVNPELIELPSDMEIGETEIVI